MRISEELVSMEGYAPLIFALLRFISLISEELVSMEE